MMAWSSLYGWVTVVVSGSLLASCALLPVTSEMVSETEDASEEAIADPAVSNRSATTAAAAPPAPESDPASEPPTANQPNYFSEGVTRAESAVTIGQSAQSPDDWHLAAGRWAQAVRYMEQVPETDPNYTTAQQKVQEYGQNLALAEQRAAGEIVAPAQPVAPDRPPGLVATIPVVGQMGGTPVVPVTLTGDRGSQQFTMLFDTGASATLITPAMAEAIGVIVTGSATVTVADGRQVEIPVGYVDTLQVGDLVVRDIWVGIGGGVALLGQDVYGNYGLSIGRSQINLYE